jgi:hypothetical protein
MMQLPQPAATLPCGHHSCLRVCAHTHRSTEPWQRGGHMHIT